MKNLQKYALIFVAAAMLVACGPSREERVEQIEDFEDSLFELAIAADPATADELTALYESFASKYPDDPLTPQYLMKAADVQSNVLHTERAIQLYDQVINNYPDFQAIPDCYMLKGHTYELNSQYEEAREAYQIFVDKFPDHYMADQIRITIPRVGMSNEEMLADILAHANDTIIAQSAPVK